MVEISRPINILVKYRGVWTSLNEIIDIYFIVYPVYINKTPSSPEKCQQYVNEAEGWAVIDGDDPAWGIAYFKTISEAIRYIASELQAAGYPKAVVNALKQVKITCQ